MSDDEFDNLRKSVESRRGDELAVISPSRVEKPPAIEATPEPVDDPQADAALPETENPTLEIPTAAGSEMDQLETSAAVSVENESLDVVSAPATGEERLPPTDPPVAASETLDTQAPSLTPGEPLEIPTVSDWMAFPEISDSEREASQNAVGNLFTADSPLPVDVAPTAAGETFDTPEDPTGAADTLEIPVAPSSDEESLPTPSETRIESGEASVPSAPEARLSDDLASPEAPQAPNQDVLEIPVWNDEPSPALGTQRNRQFAEPTLETSNSPSMRTSPLDTPQEPSGPAGDLPTGYVPLDPGRSDLWVHPGAFEPPDAGIPDELSEQVQSGFNSVRDRLMDAMATQLQEQAIFATMRETDL